MNKVYIGLGSNKGNRPYNLKRAIDMIEELELVQINYKSDIYKTRPMYNKNQKNFLNMVLELNTSIKPLLLLKLLKKIESRLGRKLLEERNQEREIDIDILDYDNIVLNNKELILPHPYILERVFVLKPWSDIAPDFKLPNIDENIFQLLMKLNIDLSIIKKYNK